MCRLDIKDVYLMVPIDKNHTKFLRFVHRDQLYQFLSLSFGLSSAPLVFTKLIKPVLGYLRETGIKFLAYLDDFLIMENSDEACEWDCKVVS